MGVIRPSYPCRRLCCSCSLSLLQAKADASAELAKKVELDAVVAACDAAAKSLATQRDVALELIPNELDPTVPRY